MVIDMSLGNPYVGPQPLSAADQIYGRAKEIAGLADLLTVKRVVLFHSPSGAGKSSILHARGGVRDQLDEQFDVWATTRVNTEPTIPVANRFVWSSLMGFEQEVPIDRRREPSALATLTLAEGIATRARKRNAKQFSVLIFDQFEEVLRVDPSRVDEKREFFRQLGELLANRDFWAMFVLREDYLAALEPYSRFVPTHMQNRYRVDLLSVEAARDAIEMPASACGREYAAEALDKLVDDLARVKVQQPDGTYADERGPFIEPMQLQVACFNLWEKMDPDDPRVDPEDIAKHGDVTEALASYYASRVAQIAAGDVTVERAVRRWIGTELITPDGVRSQVLKGPKTSQGLSNTLIEELEKAHLVRPEQRGSSVRFELAHDRLVQPVTTNNAKWFDDHLSPMQKRAELWNKQGQPESMLVTGEDIERLREWTPSEKFEKDFVRLSETRDRMLRRDHLKTRLSLALAVAALIAFGLALTMYRRTLDQQKTLVDSNGKLRKALAVADLIEARRILGLGQLENTIAFIARALRRDPESRQAMWSLQQIVTSENRSHDGESIAMPDGIRNASIAGDESRLVTVDETGRIAVWDPRTNRKICQVAQHRESAYLSAIQPGARRFLLVSNNGAAEFWSTESCTRSGPEFTLPEPVLAVGFQPETALTLSRTGKINRIRLVANPYVETVGAVKADEFGQQSAKFSANGREVAISVKLTPTDVFSIRVFSTEDPATFRKGPDQSSQWTADGELKLFAILDSKKSTILSLHPDLSPIEQSVKPVEGQRLLMTDGGRLYVADKQNGIRSSDCLRTPHWYRTNTIGNDAIPVPGGHRFLTFGNSKATHWRTFDDSSVTPVSSEFDAGEWTSKAASRDGSRLLALSERGKQKQLFIVDSRTGRAIGEPVLVECDELIASMSGNGRRFAATLLRDTPPTMQTVAWEAESGERIFQTQPRTRIGSAVPLVMSDDGALILTTESETAASIYRMKERSLVGTPTSFRFDIPKDGRVPLAFSRSGARFAVATTPNDATTPSDATLQTIVSVFDMATSQQIGTNITFPRRVTAVTFSDDGQRLAVGRSDCLYEVFNAETGVSMGSRNNPKCKSGVTGIHFTPDSRGLLAVTGDVTLYQRLWDLDNVKNLSPYLADVAELYSGSLLTDDGILRKLTKEERHARLDRVHEPGYRGPLRINEIIERLSK